MLIIAKPSLCFEDSESNRCRWGTLNYHNQTVKVGGDDYLIHFLTSSHRFVAFQVIRFSKSIYSMFHFSLSSAKLVVADGKYYKRQLFYN